MSDSIVPVAVCDDHAVYRRELMTALESDSDIQVVAEADMPSGLGPIVNEHPPHVIVVDLSPPKSDPAQVIRTLAERMPKSQILAVGGPNDDLAVALIAGAVGAVEKTTALAMGPFIVHAVAAGRLFLDRRAAQWLLRTVHAHPRRTSIPASQVELVDHLTQVDTIAELGRDSFSGAKNERELVALLGSLRARRASDS
ncbi:MAG: response regulator transcription factor [Acidimicrobiales bacterium]|nr:response regulator transcription factor [Acidimicrobiales bacterium]